MAKLDLAPSAWRQRASRNDAGGKSDPVGGLLLASQCDKAVMMKSRNVYQFSFPAKVGPEQFVEPTIGLGIGVSQEPDQLRIEVSTITAGVVRPHAAQLKRVEIQEV